MAKRKSFDEKNKHIHKSRQKIIDTVYGRASNTKDTFGWTPETDGKIERKVGDRWFDSDGKEWEQQDGFVSAVSQYDDIRQYIDSLSQCKATDCKTIKLTSYDLKMVRRGGFCLDCLAKRETEVRRKGLWESYEKWKISQNEIGYFNDVQAKLEQALKDAKQTTEIVNEDGTFEKWNFNGNIEDLKAGIQSDIEKTQELLIKLRELRDESWETIKDLYIPLFIENNYYEKTN